MQHRLRHSGPIGNRIGGGSSFSWSRYWAQHLYDENNLELRAINRSGLTITDTVGGNNIGLLTPTYKGDSVVGTSLIGNKTNATEKVLDGSSYTIYFKIKQLTNQTGSEWLIELGNNTAAGTRGISIKEIGDNVYTTCADGVNRVQSIQLSGLNANFKNKDWVEVFIQIDKPNNLFICKFIKMSTGAGFGTDVSADISAFTFNANNNADHIRVQSSIFAYADFKKFNQLKTLSQCKDNTYVTDLQFYYPTLLTGTDVSASAHHLLAYKVTGANRHFDTISTYCLDNGYTIYKCPTKTDFYVPNSLLGAEITMADINGINTYVKDQNRTGNLTGHNFAESLLGFNELSVADTELEIFDRSNTTRQEDASRSSAYYDSTSLATKCRYHISECYPHDEVFNLLFKTAYKDIVFFKILKTDSNFRLTEFIKYPSQLIGNNLLKVKHYCQIDKKFTVGVNKNWSTVNFALARSFDNYTLTIDAGVFTGLIDLTTKKINFVGSGSRGTMLFYTSGTTYTTNINIATDSTFTNLVIKRWVSGAVTDGGILNIEGCNPTFTNVRFQDSNLIAGFYDDACVVAVIKTGANVVMNNCDIVSLNKFNTITVSDTSSFTFEGGTFKAKLVAEDTAVINIDADYVWCDVAGQYLGLHLYDTSDLTLMVNVKTVITNLTTGLEATASTSYRSGLLFANNSCTAVVSGNNIQSYTKIVGDGSNILLKDIISPYGFFWVATALPVRANTIEVTFDNCQIYLDVDDDTTGVHIIEDGAGAKYNIINNSKLEFSGHSGLYYTMGNLIRGALGTELYIRDSELIGHCNDNVPYGSNYPGLLQVGGIVDIEDAILSNVDSDGFGECTVIGMAHSTALPINLRLKNVVLNNSEVGKPFITIYGADAFDGSDYICEDNVTFNGTGAEYDDELGANPLTRYATLKTNCP
jgi:hypothetical protein